jgi:hypothetical protein
VNRATASSADIRSESFARNANSSPRHSSSSVVVSWRRPRDMTRAQSGATRSMVQRISSSHPSSKRGRRSSSRIATSMGMPSRSCGSRLQSRSSSANSHRDPSRPSVPEAAPGPSTRFHAAGTCMFKTITQGGRGKNHPNCCVEELLHRRWQRPADSVSGRPLRQEVQGTAFDLRVCPIPDRASRSRSGAASRAS